MKWEGRERSSNVEDRRGVSPGMAAGGGGLGLIILAILYMVFGGKNPQQFLDQIQDQQPAAARQQAPPEDDEMNEFISVVLKDTENVWTKLFKQEGIGDYSEPRLVRFSDSVSTGGCGTASKEVGPFYCPADQQIYIDTSFFDQLAGRHRAPGDFAQAYVIAHEVAHHVQVLIGYSQKVNELRMRDKEAGRQATVRLELQADYLAGVWAHHVQKDYAVLEEGDIGEALQAANQIGDDTLMKESMGYAIPSRYTHGTSQQRVYWFTQGLKSGEFEGCKALFELDYDDLNDLSVVCLKKTSSV
ncbi:MAG: neutral zinc metallopeptidase [Pirellulaceae bacterium]